MADPARTAALEVLRAVRSADAYTNLALPAALRRHGLSGRDAAFATELASGTLRRQGLYDAVLAACVDRPLAKVQARVLDALRLGAHQLLAMRVPAHAAISTTVALVRSDVGPGAAGFANAVLRKVSEHDLDGWVGRVAPDARADLFGHLSVAHAHPRWVVEELRSGGRSATRSRRCWPPTTSRPESPWSRGPVARPATSCLASRRATRRTASGWPRATRAPSPAVAEGRAGVQDEGSQLVALALASAPLDGRTSAGSTSAPGRAARPRCSRRWPAERGARAARQRAPAAPRRTGTTCARRCRRCARRGRGRRHPPAVAARVVRPGAGRRALHRPRCAAAPTRGALAPAARGPRRARAAAEGAALVGARLRAARRSRCSTPPARRCWPRRPRSSRAVLAARPDAALEDAAALLPGGCRRGTARVRCRAPSSSGRTATGPTPCSGPCCVGSPGDRAGRGGGEPGTVRWPETVPGSPLGWRGARMRASGAEVEAVDHPVGTARLFGEAGRDVRATPAPTTRPRRRGRRRGAGSPRPRPRPGYGCRRVPR